MRQSELSGMSKSKIWSSLFALAIVGWFASGIILPAASPDEPSGEAAAPAEQAPDKPFAVMVETFKAVERPSIFPVRGLTEALRQVEVRARTAGIVEGQSFESGDAVKQGDVLCQLDAAARNAQLAKVKAQLASARRDYEATQQLARNNFAAKSKLAQDKAAMELASAEVQQVELDMSWTTITAPRDGILAADPAQDGTYIQAGGLCGTISVMDPITVAANVPERLLPNISEGMDAAAKLVTGQQVTGKITKVAMSSDRATRTFRVELSVPNPDYALREGVTTELYIPLPSTMAHKLPASALTLADDGKFGVRVVDADNKVSFVPLKILSQETDGAWVSGLPDTATVITRGQDFVIEGQVVEPVAKPAETS
jgi:membrane fusion protein, multidrug efflux system